ncbi:hypothetical protein DMENIID0001_111850 [Sergentomyia squamirostris]
MDSNGVLRKFVELCNNRQSEQISQSFASNGVIDWYGRTLKGPRKIADFFRFNDHYHHNFTDGKDCSPFEIRETHTATRQIPPENLIERTEEQPSRSDSDQQSSSDNVPSTSGGESSKGFMTPPQQNTPTAPPPLTQGRIFRKMSSSDDEDDDDGVCSIRKFKERLEEASKSGDLIPMEPKVNEATDEGGSRSHSLSRKRPADAEETESDAKIPTKRFKDADCDSGVAEGAEAEQLTDLYTELKYIEAFGTLEMLRRTKHRGVHTTPSTSHDHDQVSSHFEERATSTGSSAVAEITESQWVRETKLSISYRLHRNNNDIQFALVIYDNLTKRPTTRRNLINDFGSIVIDRATKTTTPPRRKATDKNRNPITPRKPLRF